MSFLTELKQRKVFRVGAAYLVVAWLAVQVASIALPAFDAPAWVMRVVILLFALGFPIALLLAWALEFTPDGVQFDPRGTGGKRMFAIAAALALLALGWYFIGLQAMRKHDATPDATQAARSQAGERSIAVLPLVNASGDAGQQFFSDGLSENLIITLSQFEGLTVIGRSSSFRFRDSKEDPRAIGKALGVAYLLEGSVQHAGDAVRVSAELVNTADGRALWSQRYDRSYQDLFALQDEIAQTVAAALKAKLLPDAATTRSDRPPGGSLDAYDAYLQGKFFATRGTEADDRKAIEKLILATRLDPGYALAWATLADTWMDLTNGFLGAADSLEGWKEARRTADIALGLAPDLGLAHAVRSRVLSSADLDWRGGMQEARRAMELAPADPRVRYVLSLSLASSGKVEQAVVTQRGGLAVDPLDAVTHRQLGRFQFGLGRLDEAEAATRRAIELQPAAPASQAWLVYIRILRGNADAALTTARQIAPGGWRDTAMAMALSIGPDRTAADAALQRLIDGRADENAFQIAEVHALRGDADKTFEWLQRAHRSHDPGIQILMFDPFILRFRDDPRLAAFCRSVGLPPPSATDAMGMDRIRAKTTPTR